jgi:hypothetical protein
MEVPEGEFIEGREKPKETPSGTTEAASRPTERPPLEPKPGTPKGVMNKALLGIETPELFQLAKILMGGKAPQIRKLRVNLGIFKRAEDIGPIAILIDPKTARNETELAQVLAHEIGHLIDFLPDNTLRRGNLLGRLQTLRSFLKSTIPELGPKELRSIARQAKKNLGEGASKEDLKKERERIIKQRGLISNEAVKRELIDLTKWWSGDFEGGKASYIKYRTSARELYAEALSVWLNSPGDLELRAPIFYNLLLENLNTKPQVLQAYSVLQQMLNGTGTELAQSRTNTLREMFTTAEEHIRHLRMAAENRKQSAWSGITDFIGQYVLTSGHPIFRKLGRKPIKTEGEDDAEAARYALDELFTIDAPNHTLLRNIDEQVYQPTIEMMKDPSLTNEQARDIAHFTLGEYLYHWRVANERFDIANPAGFTATPSSKQLEEIRRRIGDERYGELEGYAQKYHDLVYGVTEEAVEEGVYNEEIHEKHIKPNKDNYAAFRVTHYIDDPDIIATGVMKQIGTWSDIQNPFDATNLKIVRLNRLIQLNKAKNRVRVFLRNNFPEEITEVPLTPDRKPKKRPKKGYGHIMELVDGKPTYWEVPIEYAKSFKMHDIGGLGKFAAINNIAYKIFHPLFVTYSPGFVIANPFRDLRRAWVNLGATDNIKLKDILVEWVKSLPTAARRAKGIDDEVIREMYDSHALDIPYTSVDAEGIGENVESLFTKHGLRPEEKPKLQRIPIIGRLLSLIEAAGQITETATKVAGYKLLKAKGVPVQERAWRTRKYVGTPDYKQRGLATPITNSMHMYSRVRWNGMAADIGLATNPETAAGWWWRHVINIILPTSIAKLGAYGALGYAIRALFGVEDEDDESLPGKVATWTDEAGKRIAKYFLTDYDVFPLGVNREGKAVFGSIPRDDLGKFIARAWWHMTDAVGLVVGKELREKETTRDLVGHFFTDLKEELLPSFSPPIEIASKWIQYGAGVNPVDSFYNEQIVPGKEWRARRSNPWMADRKMVAWTLDQFGMPGSVVHYAASPLLGESFEIGTSGGTEAVLKTIGALTGLNRLLRVSDSGLKNQQWALVENADQEDAAFRLSLPLSAQKASTNRYFLMRREAVGDQLSTKEKNELYELNLFYNAAYVPLRSLIQEAEDAKQDSSEYRSIMKKAADNPMSLIGDPPSAIEGNVKKYLYGIINSATKPVPDKKNYRGRPGAYLEARQEYNETLEERHGRIRFLVPSFEQAYQLLRQEYQRKGGVWDRSRAFPQKKESFTLRTRELRRIYNP